MPTNDTQLMRTGQLAKFSRTRDCADEIEISVWFQGHIVQVERHVCIWTWWEQAYGMWNAVNAVHDKFRLNMQRKLRKEHEPRPEHIIWLQVERVMI